MKPHPTLPQSRTSLKTSGRRGRPRTRGRFKNHSELVDKIVFLYTKTDCSLAHIARNCKVSEGVVYNVIEENSA